MSANVLTEDDITLEKSCVTCNGSGWTGPTHAPESERERCTAPDCDRGAVPTTFGRLVMMFLDGRFKREDKKP